jgi:hypothetical protein
MLNQLLPIIRRKRRSLIVEQSTVVAPEPVRASAPVEDKKPVDASEETSDDQFASSGDAGSPA